VPHAAGDILNRINEISFNSSLMREMRAVSFVTKLVTQNRIVDEICPQRILVADMMIKGQASLAPSASTGSRRAYRRRLQVMIRSDVAGHAVEGLLLQGSSFASWPANVVPKVSGSSHPSRLSDM